MQSLSFIIKLRLIPFWNVNEANGKLISTIHPTGAGGVFVSVWTASDVPFGMLNTDVEHPFDIVRFTNDENAFNLLHKVTCCKFLRSRWKDYQFKP